MSDTEQLVTRLPNDIGGAGSDPHARRMGSAASEAGREKVILAG